MHRHVQRAIDSLGCLIEGEGSRHDVGRTRDRREPLVGARTVGTPLAREKLDDIIDPAGSERPGSKIAAGTIALRAQAPGSSDGRKP